MRSGILAESGNVRLVVSTAPDLSDAVRSPSVPANGLFDDRVAALAVSGLEANTLYHYAVEVDGVLDDHRGTFRTFPSGSASFHFTVGACSETGSSHPVFETIAAEAPLFHLITGDFFYADIGTSESDRFRAAYRANLTSPQWKQLLGQTPIAYVWDDHDFGPNNSNGSSLSKSAAQFVYREMTPHYPLPSSGPIHQTFEVGRVRVILMDLRSERTVQSAPDNAVKTTLGREQKAWLKDELIRGKRENDVIVSSPPFPGSPAMGPTLGTAIRRNGGRLRSSSLIMISKTASA